MPALGGMLLTQGGTHGFQTVVVPVVCVNSSKPPCCQSLKGLARVGACMHACVHSQIE